jgi:hypothetical protein
MRISLPFLEHNIWDMGHTHFHKEKLCDHKENVYLVTNGREFQSGRDLKFNLACKKV